MLKVGAAHTPAEKTRLLCPLLPAKPEPSLPKLIDSDLWLATITNQYGTHIVECQETTQPQIQRKKMDTISNQPLIWPSLPGDGDTHQDAKKATILPYKSRSMQDVLETKPPERASMSHPPMITRQTLQTENSNSSQKQPSKDTHPICSNPTKLPPLPKHSPTKPQRRPPIPQNSIDPKYDTQLPHARHPSLKDGLDPKTVKLKTPRKPERPKNHQKEVDKTKTTPWTLSGNPQP